MFDLSLKEFIGVVLAAWLFVGLGYFIDHVTPEEAAAYIRSK